MGLRTGADYESVASETDYVALREAAVILGIHWKVLRRAIDRGELPAFKICSRIRIRRTDLDVWLESCRVRPMSEARDA